MKTKNLKKILTLAVSFLYVLATLITGGLFFATTASAATNVLNAIQGYGAIESGKYSYIYFGEYPQRRVLEVTNGTAAGKTGWDTFPNYCPDSVAVENTIKGYIAELNEQYYNKYLPAVGSGEIYDAVSTHFTTNSISFGSYDWENSTIYSFYPQQNFETKNLYFDYTTGYYTLKTNVVYPNSAVNKTPGAIAYAAGTRFHTYNVAVDSSNKYYGYTASGSTEVVRPAAYYDNTFVTTNRDLPTRNHNTSDYWLKLEDGSMVPYNTTKAGETYLYLVEPIKWRVLSKNGNVAFVMSETVLDTSKFNLAQNYKSEWAYSNIRSWLNGINVTAYYDTTERSLISSNRNFYNVAFDISIQNAIVATEIVQDSWRSYYNGKWHYYQQPEEGSAEYESFSGMGGSNAWDFDAHIEERPTTQDKVFLLSGTDLSNSQYGFKSNISVSDYNRKAFNTDYSIDTGCYDSKLVSTTSTSIDYSQYYSGNNHGSMFILRSARNSAHASVGMVGSAGGVSYRQLEYTSGIRPALNIDLSKLNVASVDGNTTNGWLTTDGSVPSANGTIDSPIALDYASQTQDGTVVNTSVAFSMGENTYASVSGELVAGTDAASIANKKGGSWQIESITPITEGTNAGKYKFLVKVDYNDQVAGSYLVARLVNTSNNQNVAMAPITSVLVNNSTPDNNTSTYFVSGTTYFEFVGANDKPTYKVIVYACVNGSLQTAGVYPHLDGNLNGTDVSSFLQDYTDNGNAFDYVYFGEYPKTSIAKLITSADSTDGYDADGDGSPDTTYGTFTADSVAMTNDILGRIATINERYYNVSLKSDTNNPNYKKLVEKHGGVYPFSHSYKWLDTSTKNEQGIYLNNSNLTVEYFYPLEDYAFGSMSFDYETGYYTLNNTLTYGSLTYSAGTKIHVFNYNVDCYQKSGDLYNPYDGTTLSTLTDPVTTNNSTYFSGTRESRPADMNGDGTSVSVNWTDKYTSYLFEVEPIKWRVLEVEGNNVTFLSDYIIDTSFIRYRSLTRGSEWEYSLARYWLNGIDSGALDVNKTTNFDRELKTTQHTFIDKAFSKSIQDAMVERKIEQSSPQSYYDGRYHYYTQEALDSAITTYENTNGAGSWVGNGQNLIYSVESRPTTYDKIWVLSSQDMINPEYGFNSSQWNGEGKVAYNTDYAVAAGNNDLSLSKDNWIQMTSGSSGGQYFLRNPINEYYFNFINGWGTGLYAFHNGLDGIRPCLTLDLSKLNICQNATASGYEATPINTNNALNLSGVNSDYYIYAVNTGANIRNNNGSWQALSVQNSDVEGYYTHKIRVDFQTLRTNEYLVVKVSDKYEENVAFSTIAIADSFRTYFTFDGKSQDINDYIIEFYVAVNGNMEAVTIYQKDADGNVGAQGTIWLDPVLGSDSNTGLLEAYPIKTLDQAIKIAGKNATIIIKNTIYITSDTTIDFGNKNVTIKRYYTADDYFTGHMFEVGVWDDTKTQEENNANKIKLTLGNVKFDGGGSSNTYRDGYSRAFYITNANVICSSGTSIRRFANNCNGRTFYLTKNSSITFNGGIYENNHYTSGSGGVVYAIENSSIIVNDGSFTGNCGYEAGCFYVKNSSLEIYGGYFKNQGNAGAGSFEVDNATKVYISNVTFEEHKNLGASPYAGVMGIFNCKNIDITIINCKFLNNQTVGSGGVFYIHKNTNTTFKIYNCEFIGNKSTAGSGGVIYATNENTGSKLEINNCIFVDGSSYNSGGAIYSLGVNIDIANCLFENNEVTYMHNTGGAIRCENAELLKIIDSQFIANKTTHKGGAAISANNINVEIDNCLFENNDSDNVGGAINVSTDKSNKYSLKVTSSNFKNNFAHASGGAIYSWVTAVYVDNCEFDNNKTNTTGGAISINRSRLSVYNSRFTNNSILTGASNGGGAIYTSSECTDVYIESCDFIGNIARGNGGAVSLSAQKTNIVKDSQFISNQANYNSGGAIFCSEILFVDGGLFKGNSAPRTGGAISTVSVFSTWNNPEGFHTEANYFYVGGDVPQATIKNAIFEDNYLTDTTVSTGGAVCLAGNSKPDSIDNCIFKNHTAVVGGAVVGGANGTLTITNSIFEGNTATGSFEYVADSGTGKPVYTTSGGGAVAILGTTLNVDKCDFVGNSATAGNGGAISTAITTTSVSVYNSNFVDNSASSSGGAVNVDNNDSISTGITISCPVIFDNCYFEGNTADVGGAVRVNGYNNENDTKYLNCIFVENVATNYGGAVYTRGGLIDGVYFARNSSVYGGALTNIHATNIYNTIFEYNYAELDGFAINRGSALRIYDNVKITNNFGGRNYAVAGLSNDTLKGEYIYIYNNYSVLKDAEGNVITNADNLVLDENGDIIPNEDANESNIGRAAMNGILFSNVGKIRNSKIMINFGGLTEGAACLSITASDIQHLVDIDCFVLGSKNQGWALYLDGLSIKVKNVNKTGVINYTAYNYINVYDGEEHTIDVRVYGLDNYTITYGLAEGVYDLTEAPMFRDVTFRAGSTSVVENKYVYFKITSPGLPEIKSRALVYIGKQVNSFTFDNPELKVWLGQTARKEIFEDATDLSDKITGVYVYDVNGNVVPGKILLGGFSGDNYTFDINSLTTFTTNADIYIKFVPDNINYSNLSYKVSTAKVRVVVEYDNLWYQNGVYYPEHPENTKDANNKKISDSASVYAYKVNDGQNGVNLNTMLNLVKNNGIIYFRTVYTIASGKTVNLNISKSHKVYRTGNGANNAIIEVEQNAIFNLTVADGGCFDIIGQGNGDSNSLVYNSGTLNITGNVKFSENLVHNGTSYKNLGNGGIIYNYASGIATLDGCTFYGSVFAKKGAVIYNLGSFTMKNSEFHGYTTGSGIRATVAGGFFYNEGALTIYDTFMEDGHVHLADSLGGAGIYAAANSIVKLYNTVITECLANYNETDLTVNSNGGGIFVGAGADVYLENCEITKNKAYSGAGIYVEAADKQENGATLKLVNTKVDSNTLMNGTTVLFGNGAGLYIGNYAVFEIIGGSISNNVAYVYNETTPENSWTNRGDIGQGGAFFARKATVTIDGGTLISKNQAARGAGAYIYDSILNVNKCVFISNIARNYVSTSETNPLGNGGAIFASDPKELNLNAGSVFMGNNAREGATIYAGNYTSNPNVVNINGAIIKQSTNMFWGILYLHGANLVTNFYSGEIVDNYGVYYGTINLNNTTFNMYGGLISRNTSNGHKVGIYMTATTFNMYGGEISYNDSFVEAASGANIWMSNSSKMLLDGGQILYNSASCIYSQGNSIYVADRNSKLTILSGKVLSAIKNPIYGAKQCDIFFVGSDSSTTLQFVFYGGEVDSVYFNNALKAYIGGSARVNYRFCLYAYNLNSDSSGERVRQTYVELRKPLTEGANFPFRLLNSNITYSFSYFHAVLANLPGLTMDEIKDYAYKYVNVTAQHSDSIYLGIFDYTVNMHFGTHHMALDGIEDTRAVFFDPISGNDSNDAITYDKALKTWEAAIAKAQKYNVKTIKLTSTWTLSNGTVFDAQGYTILRNGGEVMFNITSGSTVTIKNVVIDGTSVARNNGLITNYGNLTLQDLTIQNCRYHNYSVDSNGAGIYNEGTLTATNCNFFGLEARANGGAIYSVGGTTVTIDNCRFENNVAAVNGGAICVKADKADGTKADVTLNITNSTFFNNRATTTDSSYGGAIYVKGAETTVKSNTYTITNWVNLIIDGCEFNSNYTAYQAGAIFAEDTNIQILNSEFINNNSKGIAAVARINSSNINIDGCLIKNNSASSGDNDGSIMYLHNTKLQKLKDTAAFSISYKNCIVESNKTNGTHALNGDYISSYYDVTIDNIKYVNNGGSYVYYNANAIGVLLKVYTAQSNINDVVANPTITMNNIVFDRNLVGNVLLTTGKSANTTINVNNMVSTNNYTADSGLYFNLGNKTIFNANGIYCDGNIQDKASRTVYAGDICVYMYSEYVTATLSNINIKNLKYTGIRLTTGKYNNVTLNNVKITKCSGVGIDTENYGRSNGLQANSSLTINNIIVENTTYTSLELIAFAQVTINNANINNSRYIYVQTSTVTFNNCHFQNLTCTSGGSGGAVYIRAGGGTFNNCYFINNKVTNHGGAVYIDNDSRGYLYGCYFINNTADFASAAHGKFAVVDHCYFEGNKSSRTDNGTGDGGTLSIQITCTLSNTTFISNSGPRLVSKGHTVNIRVENCDFINNSSVQSLFYKYGGSAEYINCLFEGNAANLIRAQGGSTIVRDCIFRKNINPNTTREYDNLFSAYNDNAKYLIENCVFEDNESLHLFNLGYVGENGTVQTEIRNNLFINNKCSSSMFTRYGSSYKSKNCFYNNKFSGNQATVLISDRYSLVDGCEFINNVTTSGGIIAASVLTEVYNTTFIGNVSESSCLFSVSTANSRYDFENCNFYDNFVKGSSTNYGMFYVNNSELILDGCKMSNNVYWSVDANAYLQNSVYVNNGYAYMRDCVISSKNSAGYNASPNGVIYISANAQPCVMVGCQVENGAFGNSSAIVNKSTLSVVDMVAHGNVADKGTIISNYGILNISGDNTNFSGNVATQKGGVIYNNAGARLTVNVGDGVFNGNKANYGGAIYNDLGASLVIANGTFKANTAEANADGSISGNGGAIYNLGALTINDALFTENLAQNGGGLYNLGTVTINNGVFNKNYTTVGGGAIYNTTETLAEYSDTTFIGEIVINYADVQANRGSETTEAQVYGLGIYNSANLTINDGIYEKNSTATVAIYGGSFYFGSGAITNIFGGYIGSSGTATTSASFYFDESSISYISNVELNFAKYYQSFSKSNDVIFKNCEFTISCVHGSFKMFSTDNNSGFYQFYSCTFNMESTGASAFIGGSRNIFDSCIFKGHAAGSLIDGGKIKNCTFDNLVSEGNLIGCAQSGTLYVENCSFRNVTANGIIGKQAFAVKYSVSDVIVENCNIKSQVFYANGADELNLKNIYIINNIGRAINIKQYHQAAQMKITFLGNNIIKNNRGTDAAIKWEMGQYDSVPTLVIGNGGKLIVEDNFLCDENGNYVDKDGNITTDPTKYVQSNISIPHKTSKKGYLIGGLAEGSRVGINVYLTETGASLYNEFVAVAPKDASKPITTSDFECFFYDNNEYGLALRGGNIVLVKPSEITGDKVYVSDKIYLVDGQYKGFDKADFEVYKNSVKVTDFDVLYAENEEDFNAGIFSAVSPKYASLGEYTVWYKIVDSNGEDLTMADGSAYAGSVNISFVKHLLTVVSSPVARLSKGETLANALFVGGVVMSNGYEVAGTWTFEASDTIPTDNTTKYKANFVASASNIYSNSVSVEIPVEFLFTAVDYKIVSGINEDKPGFYANNKFTGITLLSEIVPLMANNGVINIYATYTFVGDEVVTANNTVRILRNSALGTNNIFEISNETDISVVIGGGVGKFVFDGTKNNYTQKLFVNNSTLTLGANVEVYNFINNSDTGAVIVNSGTLNLNGANFRNNLAYALNEGMGKGGLIYNTGVVNINGGNFVDNTVQKTGTGDPAVYGGVLYNDGGRVVVSGGTFTNNRAVCANSFGGVIYNNGGTIDICGGVFNKNEASYGGVLASRGGKVVFSGGQMVFNKASVEGAVIYNDESDSNANNWGEIIYNGSEMLKNSILGNGEVESAIVVGNVNWLAIVISILSVILVGVFAGILLHKNLRGKRN